MNKLAGHIQKLVDDGARRLLERAQEPRGLSISELSPRILLTLQKYLLCDQPNAGASEIQKFVDSLQADDLCLIVACERGDADAWSDLVERFSATVKSAARSASSNEAAAEDLSQSIWAELHGLRTREDGRPAGKLAYYSGRGSLAGWLRAVVGQLAIDAHRKQSRLVQTEEDADFDRLAREPDEHSLLRVQSVNPEEVVTNKVAVADLQVALAKAVKNLSPEDRLLVKLYYFDNLRLKEAGTVLGVHEATASRRLSRIHGEIRNNVETLLISEHSWTKQEAERAFAEVAVHLETDLEQLVGDVIVDNK